jgi:Cu/Ag efflux protein CusF
MKSKLLELAAITLLPAAMLVFTSCSSTPEGEGATMVAAQRGVPGGIMVETRKITATVLAVDSASRKVTLSAANGKKNTFKAGPDVVNFNQIQVGDIVKATVTRELVVFARKMGEPATDGQAGAIALAPVGAKPGVLMADTAEVIAKVQAIDLKRHKVTLRFPDGTSETFDVRPDVDLTNAKLGDEVVIRTTEAVAILVEKP